MKFLLLLSAALAVASATYDPFYFGQGNEEVVFRYYSDVRNEVTDPLNFASQFALRGDLHIRNDKAGNGTIFWLRNVEIYAYNGKDFYTWDKIPQWTPLPKTAEAYLTPFYVTYYETGLVDDIIFQQNAPEWVYNIHRGIASVFQLNWARIGTQTRNTPFAFEVYENTIYGNSSVAYEVIPSATEYVITKYQDPRTAQGYSEQHYENYFAVRANPELQDDFYRTTSEREYYVARDGSVRRITTFNRIAQYPFKNQHNTQFVTVKQQFEFVNFVAPSETFNYADFVVYLPLTFTAPRTDSDSYTPDLSYGFFHFDVENVKRVRDIFYEAVEYLETLPINNEVPDNRNVKQGQAINRIVSLLRHLSVEQFQTVYEFFASATAERDVLARTLFFRVLPTVGTRPAALFVRDLIKNGKVAGFEAAQLLYTLGTNFVVPTEQILTDLEEFLHFDGQRPEIRNAAILTYATLVYKTFYRNTNNYAGVEKYIKQYYVGLQQAKTYEERLTYLQGLGNIRLGSVFDLLRPIVLGEQIFDTPYDRHFRVHAIWQIIYAVRERHVDAFETFWPVLVDNTLPLELRVAALKGVLATGTFSELKYVFQYIRQERNVHLANYFYTFVHSVEALDTEIYAYVNKTHFAEQVEYFYNNQPYDVNTRAFAFDYFDEDTSLGYLIGGNYIANETSNKVNQVFYSLNRQYGNYYFNNFAAYIRFEGIEFPLDTFFSDIYSFDLNVWRTKFLQRTGEPLHIEIIFTFHDQVFFVRHFDETTFAQLFAELFQFFNLVKFQYTGVFYGVQEEIYVPTDFGFPANFYTYIPYVFQFQFNPAHLQVEKEALKFKFSTYVRVWSHAVHGIQIYNPLSSATQGVRRVLAYDLNSPFNLDIAIDYVTKTNRINHLVNPNELYNTFGIKTHVLSQVYTLPDRTYNILQQVNGNYSQYVIATNPQYRNSRDIYEYHSRFFGRGIYFGVYDYEYTPYDQFNDFGFPRDLLDFDYFFNDFRFDAETRFPFRRYFLSFHNWFIRNAFATPVGNFGFLFYNRPCTRYPVNEWSFVANVNRNQVDKYTPIPDYHYIINSTVTTRYNGQFVTEYTWQNDYKHTDGHAYNDYYFHFVRRVAESNERVHYLFTREKTYHDQGVDGVYKFYYGTNYEQLPVYDQFLLTAEFHAERSREQQAVNTYSDPHYTYSECQPIFPWVVNYTTTAECILAHASLRQYRYFFNWVNYQQLSTEYQNYFEKLWHYLLVAYRPQYKSTPVRVTGQNSFALEYVYPIASFEREVYAAITLPTGTYTFDRFPMSPNYFYSELEYLYIPEYFRFARQYGYYNVCEVYVNTPEFRVPHFNLHTLAAYYPVNTWQLYAANQAKNYSWAVYTQYDERFQLATRFVIGDQWFIVRPVEEVGVSQYGGKYRYQFTTSNEGLEYVAGSNNDLYGIQIFYARDTVVFVLPQQGVMFTYNGNAVRVINFNEFHNYTGYCYKH